MKQRCSLVNAYSIGGAMSSSNVSFLQNANPIPRVEPPISAASTGPIKIPGGSPVCSESPQSATHAGLYSTSTASRCCAVPRVPTDVNGVTGTYSVSPGFPSQTTSCVNGREGGIGYAAVRLAVRWLPSENLVFDVIGDLTNENQDYQAETLGYAGPGPLVGNASALAASSPALAIPTTNGHLLPYNEALVPKIIPKNFYSTYANFCMPAPSVVGSAGPLGNNFGQQAYCVDPKQTVNSWGVSMATDRKFADNLSLKDVVALRGYAATWVHDNDVSVWPLDLGAESMGHHQFSDELRLNGNYNKWLDWTVGGYYFSEKTVYFGHEDLSSAFIFTGLPNLLNFYQNDPVVARSEVELVRQSSPRKHRSVLFEGQRHPAHAHKLQRHSVNRGSHRGGRYSGPQLRVALRAAL
ncbi:MAG: TonB-dependent receptor [Gammaproteobacteria bacterium]|nr:TonB-dependent receptor [Gammaproteobacteria bacterium]